MTTRTLARLAGLAAGYLLVFALERLAYAAGIADERLVEANTAAAWTGDDGDDLDVAEVVGMLVAVDVSDVLAAHDCVCCRSGAAVPPEGAAR